MTPLKLAIVGVGKIARDQHIPAIAATPAIELAATSSRHGSVDGVENYADFDDLLSRRPDIEAVALCMPPHVRHAYAAKAIAAGRHVLLEKPPGATLSEVELLVAAAGRAGVSLFATWHTRFAPGVETMRSLLADAAIRSVRIDWKEDVRRWHPGQDWIWEPGGLGVFDPGINALAIATEVLPDPMFLTSARLLFPENKATPIAAELAFTDARGVPVTADFDWRQTGGEIWDVRVESDKGRMVLGGGGKRLTVDDAVVFEGPDREYAAIYARFAALVASGESDVDLSPLRHVADAFMLGRRENTTAFV